MQALDQKYGETKRLRFNYFELGRTYFGLDKDQKAEKAFSDAISYDGDEPLDWELHYYLARTFERQNKNLEAIKTYLNTLASGAENSSVIFDAIDSLVHDESTSQELLQWWETGEASSLIASLQEKFTPDMNVLLGTIHRVTMNLDKAESYFSAVIENDGENLWSRALVGLADIHYLRKEYEKAEELIKKALALSALSENEAQDIHFRLAMIFISQERNDEAKNELDRLFEYLIHKDTAAIIKSMAARQYVRLGSWQRAIDLIDNLEADELSAKVYGSKIESLIALHQYSNANKTALDALKSFPFDNRLFFMRIQTLIEGDLDIAKGVTLFRESFLPEIKKDVFIERLNAAYKRRYEDNNANFFMAIIYVLLEEPAEVYNSFIEKVRQDGLADDVDAKVKSTYPTKTIFLLDGYASELQNNYTEAANHFYEAARRYYWEAKYSKSTEYFEKSKELNRNNRPLYWYLADSYRLLSRIGEPPYNDVSLLKQGLENWYDDHNAGPIENQVDYWSYLVAGRIHNLWYSFESDRFKEETWKALIFTERALVHEKGRDISWTDLGTFYSYMGLFLVSVDAHERAIVINKEDTFAIQEYTKSLLNIYRFEEALEQMKKLESLTPNASFTIAWKAFIYYVKMEFEKAAELFQQYLEKVNDDVWAHAMLMESLAMVNRHEDSRIIAERLLKFMEDPRRVRREPDYARAYYFLGEVQNAIDLTEDFCQRSGDLYSSCDTLYQYYLCNRDWDKAIIQFDYFLSKELRIRSLELHRNGLENFSELEFTLYYRESVQNKTTKGDIEAFIAENKWVEQINQKIEVLAVNKPSMQFELQNTLAVGKLEDGSYSWLALQAGVARTYWENREYPKAIEKYELLEKYDDIFPDASMAIRYIDEEQKAD